MFLEKNHLDEKRALDSKVYEFKSYRDSRGTLVAGEFGIQIPFIPKRYFLVHDVTPGEKRGQHAHRICQQLLTCVSGQCRAILDDGKSKKSFDLASPSLGLYVSPMTWVTLESFSPGATLLVFASEHYEESDYIRDYEKFRQEISTL